MTFYRSQQFYGPGTNEVMKHNVFDNQKVIAGWPNYYVPSDYFPKCNCKDAEYAGQCDCLKDMKAASELYGLNRMNISATGKEPFITSAQYEGFFTDNPWIMWGTIFVTLIVLVTIIILLWYFLKSKPEATQMIRTATQAPINLARSAAAIPGQALGRVLPSKSL